MNNTKRTVATFAKAFVLVTGCLLVLSLGNELNKVTIKLQDDVKIIEELRSRNEELLNKSKDMDKQINELQDQLKNLKQKQDSNDQDIQSLKDKVSFLPENMKIDRKVNTVVTAYTVYEGGKKPGNKAFGITATGTQATVNRTVAVDPRLIPLGSTIYIPYFSSSPNKGIFRAEDTGVPGLFGVDVLVANNEAAYAIGRGVKEVYILK